MLSLSGRLITFQSIIEQPLPPIDWVIEPLIPHHNRVVVFGEFGSKKSWLLLDLGLHIAGGVRWLDRFSIPQSRSVLYIDEEMSEYELRRRVKLLGTGASLDGKDIPFRAISHLGLKFVNQARTEDLLRGLKLEGFDPDIVIIETLRRVLHGSENEAKDVGDFWHSVSPFLTAGKTLIVSHHMRKSNAGFVEAARNRASGSTDILAAADAAFAVTQMQGELLKVQSVKSRSAKEPEPFVFRLVDDHDGEAAYLTTEGDYAVSEEVETQQEKAVNLIDAYFLATGNESVKTKDLYAHLAEQGISHRTAERAYSLYKAMGTLEQVRTGEYRRKMGEVAA